VVGRAAKYHEDGIDRHMIAERMNVKVGTVNGYLSRARYRSLVNTTEREEEKMQKAIYAYEDKPLKDKEILEIQERILSAAPGTNVVYYEHPIGWSKVPQNLREMITSMANSGLIVQLLKRNDQGTFSMIAQRTKRK
jgi:hypothetical protein